MVKSIISVIIASALIAVGGIYENFSLRKTFDEMISCVDEISVKLVEGDAVTDDITSLQKLWLTNKKSLHAYIPHTEIKELDLWISECVSYVKLNKYDEALSKLEVVKELCEQIPKTFLIRFENLF